MHVHTIKMFSLSVLFAAMSLTTAYASDMMYTGGVPTAEKVIDQSALYQDYEGLKAEAPRIVYMADHYSEENGFVSRFAAEDIDWSRLTKMYLPTKAILTAEPDIEAFMGEAEYIWTLPVDVESKSVEVVFNLGKAVGDDVRHLLTDEELAQLEAYQGKWCAVGGRYFDHIIDYRRDIDGVLAANGLLEGYEYFTLTALYGINMPMTVVMKDNVPLYIFPTMSELREMFNRDYGLPVIGTVENGIYRYEDVVGIANDYLSRP